MHVWAVAPIARSGHSLLSGAADPSGATSRLLGAIGTTEPAYGALGPLATGPTGGGSLLPLARQLCGHV